RRLSRHEVAHAVREVLVRLHHRRRLAHRGGCRRRRDRRVRRRAPRVRLVVAPTDRGCRPALCLGDARDATSRTVSIEPVRVVVPGGMLGGGFTQASIERGIELGADAIAIDAGSTDSEPAYLAAAAAKVPTEAIPEDP